MLPRPRHPSEEVVREVLAEFPAWGPARVVRHLEAERSLPADIVPSERTVGRIKKEFLVDQQAPYRRVKWPETFQESGLPWDSAPAVMELLFENRKRGLRPPPVRFAYWFWRVSQVSAGTVEERRPLAALLAMADLAEEPQAETYRREVEAVLTGGDDLILYELLNQRPEERTLSLVVQGWRKAWGE